MTYTIDEKKVIYADLDPKEGIVLNLDSKFYYRLNETGQLIWQGLAGGQTETNIAERLADNFDVSFDEALPDVKTLVEKLKTEQLIFQKETDQAKEPQTLSMEAARKSKKEKSETAISAATI